MADHGARHLALMGRSGAKSAEAKQLVKELEADGVNVAVIQGDISREQDVAAAFRQIAGTMPPLRGVLHSAMVLEDGLLLNLDRDWMRRVMAPKINGAWNLHRETRELPLDFFVLFSSLSSVFGHAGQGNYAAANSFLDMLAHHRRAQGLTATTINWGYLADVGYLAEREELGEQLERKGVLSFSIHEALDALERSLQLGATQISVMRVEWSRWRGLGVTGKVSPRFAHLLPESATSGQLDGMPSVEALRAAAPAQRNVTVERLLRTKLSSVLGVEPDKLDPATPLLDLGLDSLMAVELRNWMEAELELNIPIFELMRSPSLSRVVELLCAELDNDGGPSKATKGDDDTLGARPEDLLENIDDLSGERVDDLLAKLLAEKEVAS
jgi:NAD(P)-dependent dehydrogenase (short-subunit alcohol dehydrogenase family)/aryl carrier-like protein